MASSMPALAVDPLGLQKDTMVEATDGGSTVTTTEEELLQSLDTSVDNFNKELLHAASASLLSGPASLSRRVSHAPPVTVRASLGVAGAMELGRRRDMFVDYASQQGCGDSVTCSDSVVCANQLEESVSSSGHPARLYSLESSRQLLGRFWRYRKDEIEGQKMQLLLRWNRYCRSSDAIERTQQKFRDTLAHLADEHDRNTARILRIERNGAPPLPSELESYATWLLQRQQSNEPLRRFYRILQWMPQANRESIVRDIDTLLRNSPSGTPPLMPHSSSRIEQTVEPLLHLYLRAGVGNWENGAVDGKTYDPSDAISVEHDYLTESVFPRLFRAQSRGWNFLPYGATKFSAEEGRPEEAGDLAQGVPTYLKSTPWLPFVPDVEDRLHHVGLRKSTMESVSEAQSFSDGMHFPPTGPGARTGQSHTSRATMDQVLVSELEFLVEDDDERVEARLKQMALTHLERSNVSINGSSGNGQGRTESKIESDLKANSDNVFERFTNGKESVSHRPREINESQEEVNNRDGSDNPSTNNRRVPNRNTMLRVLYRLRHLHLRSLRRRLLGLLNYSRSVQRRIVLDCTGFTFRNGEPRDKTAETNRKSEEKGSGTSSFERCTNPSLDLRHEIHDIPSDLVKTAAELMQSDVWAIDGRDDDCEVESSTAHAGHNVVHVLDASGHRVIYDCTLADLDAMEQLFLSVGTDVIRSAETRLTSISKNEKTLESKGDAVLLDGQSGELNRNSSMILSAVVDRLGVLQDLFEQEVALREASRKYVETLLTAYDNTVHANERDLLSAEIFEALRERPSHETLAPQNFNRATYFLRSYGMLIKKLHSKERLVSQMVHMQVHAERRVTSQALSQNYFNGSVPKQQMFRARYSSLSAGQSISSDFASIFEVSLTMGNCARFFPLWNVILSRMRNSLMDSSLQAHPYFSDNHLEAALCRTALVHMSALECQLRKELDVMHMSHLPTEQSGAATPKAQSVLDKQATKSKENAVHTYSATPSQLVALANISALALQVADIKIALAHSDNYDEKQHKIDAMKVVSSQRNNGNEAKDHMGDSAARIAATSALNSLVSNPVDNAKTERMALRRLALVESLLLRGELAGELWESLILQDIYRRQMNLFGPECVHKDRTRKTQYESLDHSEMVDRTSIMSLKSKLSNGRMAVINVWALARAFDPTLVVGCDLLRNNSNGENKERSKPAPTSKAADPLSRLLFHDESTNHASRQLVIAKLRCTLKYQCLERVLLTSCVAVNAITTENLLMVNTLGLPELRHRLGMKASTRNPGIGPSSDTFVTQMGDNTGKVDEVTLRALLKKEQHRIRDCFVSVYEKRIEAREISMQDYRLKLDVIMSRHNAAQAAKEEQMGKSSVSAKNASPSRIRGGKSGNLKSNKTFESASSTNSMSRKESLELETSITCAKIDVISNGFAKDTLKAYRPYTLRPQCVQLANALAALTKDLRAPSTSGNANSFSFHYDIIGGKNLVILKKKRKTKAVVGGSRRDARFTVSCDSGELQNPWRIPNWFEIHTMVSESVDNDFDDTDGSDSEDTEGKKKSSAYSTPTAKAIDSESERALKCMETLLSHLQTMRKLVQCLRLHSMLISCGVDPSSSSNVSMPDMHAYSTAALDALRHEMEKLKYGVARIQERTLSRNQKTGSGGSNGHSDSESDHPYHLASSPNTSLRSYLSLRSSVEMAKLRAAFKCIHDQVTSMADIDADDASVLRTVPRVPISKSLDEQRADASAMGVKLSDYLENENGETARTKKLHTALLRMITRAMSDLDDRCATKSAITTPHEVQRQMKGVASNEFSFCSPAGMHAGGAPSAYESHLELWSRDSRWDGVFSGGPVATRGGMLSCSAGFPDPHHDEFLQVSSKVPFGSVATMPLQESSKSRQSDNDDDDSDKERRNYSKKQNLKHGLWACGGVAAPWQWRCSNASSGFQDIESIIRSASGTHEQSRNVQPPLSMMSLWSYGPFIDAQLPTSLSLWYAYASHRFTCTLTPALRNLIGAAVQSVELQVEGASMLLLNSSGVGDGVSTQTKSNTKTWNDLPDFERKTAQPASLSRPVIETEVQLRFLDTIARLRLLRLTIISMYKREMKDDGNHEGRTVIEMYRNRVISRVKDLVIRLRKGSDQNAVDLILEGRKILTGEAVTRKSSKANTGTRTFSSSNLASHKTKKTEEESKRLGREVSRAHLLLAEIQYAQEELRKCIIRAQLSAVREKYSRIQAHLRPTLNNEPSINGVTESVCLPRSSDANQSGILSFVELFRKTMMSCFQEVSPFSQDRPVSVSDLISSDTTSEEIAQLREREEVLSKKDPRRRKYHVDVDEFERCIDRLGNDVIDLLRNARSGVERVKMGINAQIEVPKVDNVYGRIPPTGPLASLCQRLNHDLCCKEEVIRLQGHAYSRQLRLIQSRCEAEITRRCYALLFEVDELKRENKSLVSANAKIHEQAVNDARKMYRNQVVELETQLINAQARFKQYQASMRADMLREISVAKKAALLKIVDSGTVTPELRQRAVKIAAVEDEMYELKKNNGDLKSAISELELKYKTDALHTNRLHEEEIEALESELAEKSKSWAQQADMERRDHQRQHELTSAQTAASRLVNAVTDLQTKLEASEDAKRKLQKAKIRNQHTMTMLEKQMSLLTAQLGGAPQDAISAASAAATASLTVDLQKDIDSYDSNDKNGRNNEISDRHKRIESARKWSDDVLEKRNANLVTSLQRQLQRAKESHRQTADMLRRAMNRIRKMEKHQEEKQKEISIAERKDSDISSTWSNAKEERLVRAKNEARKKGDELMYVRSQLGAIKEEHARLLEYLRARGITAPGGDISSSSALRYMSGFSSQRHEGSNSSSSLMPGGPADEDIQDQPYHRRTFKFSVAPSGLIDSSSTTSHGSLGSSSAFWNNMRGPSDTRNRSGFVPQTHVSTESIRPPHGSKSGQSADRWRQTISENNAPVRPRNSQHTNRPQSAPGRRRGMQPATSQRDTTLKMLETMIGSVKNREREARAKSQSAVTVSNVGTELEKRRATNESLKKRLKRKKKTRRQRPQSAGLRRSRLSVSRAGKYSRTNPSPRLGISSDHHTRK